MIAYSVTIMSATFAENDIGQLGNATLAWLTFSSPLAPRKGFPSIAASRSWPKTPCNALSNSAASTDARLTRRSPIRECTPDARAKPLCAPAPGCTCCPRTAPRTGLRKSGLPTTHTAHILSFASCAARLRFAGPVLRSLSLSSIPFKSVHKLFLREPYHKIRPTFCES